jgi:hypothetical protein
MRRLPATTDHNPEFIARLCSPTSGPGIFGILILRRVFLRPKRDMTHDRRLDELVSGIIGSLASQATAASGSFKTERTSSSGSKKDCSSTSKRSTPLKSNQASAGIFLGKFCSAAPL